MTLKRPSGELDPAALMLKGTWCPVNIESGSTGLELSAEKRRSLPCTGGVDFNINLHLVKNHERLNGLELTYQGKI